MDRASRADEPILDPDLAICDCHHHLWDDPAHPYSPDDLRADVASGHRIVATVLVEAKGHYRNRGPAGLRPVGETEHARTVAEAAPAGMRLCAGIVAHIDLRRDARVAAVAGAHRDAGGGRLRGIRQMAAWYTPGPGTPRCSAPVPALFDDPAFRRGFAQLRALGLSFDAYLYHPQLGELFRLARDFPEQPIMLDHLGTPLGTGRYAGRRDAAFAEWRAGLAELARCPNVAVKLGGLGLQACGLPPAAGVAALAAQWRPWIETAIDLFGDDRCAFESNFPVDRAAGDYRMIWNAFKRIASGCSAEVKRRLFHDNAARFYRLEAYPGEHDSPRL